MFRFLSQDMKNTASFASLHPNTTRRTNAIAKRATMLRPFRALQASCFSREIIQFPFNANDDVTAFSGLVFTMDSPSGQFVEVQTLELDIQAKDDVDMAIEIYSYDGNYASVIDNLDDWNILAITELVPNPDSSRGAIVPAHDFSSFTVGKNQKSIFIKMKGAWIDYSLDAFLGEGDAVPNENGFVTIYPGTGFADAEAFPLMSYADSSLRPIFAGSFHVLTEIATCEESPNTEVEFLLVTDLDVSEGDLSAITETIQLTVDSLFRLDSVLVGLQNDYDMKQEGEIQTAKVDLSFLGNCKWTSCTSIQSSLTWSHSDELFVDKLKYRIYTHTEMIMKEVRRMYTDNKFEYVGLVAAKAETRFVLKDVNTGLRMDQSQEDYFVRHTLDFINFGVDERKFEALSILLSKKGFVSDEIVDEGDGSDTEDGSDGTDTEGDSGVRALQEELGQLELIGEIRGIRYNHISEREFATLIQDKFFNPGRVRDYVDKMKYEVYYPGPMSEFGRHEFFKDLVLISGEVDTDSVGTEAPTEPPTLEKEDDEALKNFINNTIDSVSGWDVIVWIIIGACVFFIILIIAVFLFVRCVRETIEAKKRREERQVDKEFMRQEKRLEEIRRKKMAEQGIDVTNICPTDYEVANKSFGDDFFEQSQSYLEDSMVLDPQASAGMVGAPHGSRRGWYGPAMAQMQDPEQPIQGSMPMNGSISGDSYRSGRNPRY